MPLDFIFTLRERENARLAGGEDWIRTRGCVSPGDRGLLADKVLISPICVKRRVQSEESGQIEPLGSFGYGRSHDLTRAQVLLMRIGT